MAMMPTVMPATASAGSKPRTCTARQRNTIPAKQMLWVTGRRTHPAPDSPAATHARTRSPYRPSRAHIYGIHVRCTWAAIAGQA
jgi:hypothetical protein